MADKPFRILLDTTYLHLECFKYVWVNISPRELRTISDLKNDVLRKINIEQEFELYMNGGLLLDEETVTILRENDVVEIKYKTPNPVREPTKQCISFSRKRNLDKSNDRNDINSKKQKLESSSFSSDENENNFIRKKSKKKKKTEVPVNSENLFSAVSTQQRSPNGKINVTVEDVNSNKPEAEIVATSSNRNINKFVEKKSQNKKKKKEKEIAVYSGNISVEKRVEQTDSLVTRGNKYSTFIESNQNSKKNRKKEDKKKSPVACDFSVIDLNGECSPQNIAHSFTVTNLGSECSQQKQKKFNKASRSIISYPETVFMTTSVDDLSSKNQFNVSQNESSVFVTDINSSEVNSNSKKKRKRRRKRKKTKTSDISGDIDSRDLISNVKSSTASFDESYKRKHILYLSPDKIQESNCSNNVYESPNTSTDKFIRKDQSQEYPKMSTPAQSNVCSIPDLQLSVMASKKTNLSCNKNDSTLSDKSTTESVALQSDKEKEKQPYANLPDLTILPAVGTRIAYKTLELDESYSPIASDYRVGTVEMIDPDTEELKIRLDNEIILPARTGKFENLGKDEVPEPTVKTCDVLKWCDLIEPKLLNSSS